MRNHASELAARFAFNFLHILELYSERRTKPAPDIAPDFHFVLAPIGLAAYQTNRYLPELLLDDLSFFYVQSVFEKIIQARDARSLGCHNIIVAPPSYSQQNV